MWGTLKRRIMQIFFLVEKFGEDFNQISVETDIEKVRTNGKSENEFILELMSESLLKTPLFLQ